MGILIILASLVLALLLVAVFYITRLHTGLRELLQKAEKSISENHFFRIEFKGTSPLKNLAEKINELGLRFLKVKEQNEALLKLNHANSDLHVKIDSVNSALSHLNLLTDIGKKITSNLSLNQIGSTAFHYINSSMVADEVCLILNLESSTKYLTMNGKEIVPINNIEWCQKPDNPLNWCMQNNKEVFLLNAEEDYAQYFFEHPLMARGVKAESVMAMPLQLAEKKIGAIVVFSKYKMAFEPFHLDFMRSLSSYLAVAIENASLFEALESEKFKSEGLLLNILPSQIATELKKTGTTQPRFFNNVSVLFTDFKDFTKKTETIPPHLLVQEIDYCFSCFDDIIKKHKVEKIKTIGDAYMCASGLPIEDDKHAQNILNAALEIRDFMLNYAKERKLAGEEYFEIRIGISSGPVVAGVVGKSKFAYDIWGDTVNVASRMESASEIGMINISGSTHQLIKSEFNCTYRGKFEAKNKGNIDMYFVNAKNS